MKEAEFEQIKKAYLRAACAMMVWQNTHWNGVPFQQFPEDVVAIAEAVYQARADAVVECGVHIGGGIEFYATLLASNPRGLAVGVDHDIQMARGTVLRHPGRVKLIEGNSADPKTAEAVREAVEDRRVLVILDSSHEAAHVALELPLYAPLVSPGSYLVVMDGAMKDLPGIGSVPRDAATNNPETAIAAFLPDHPEFERDWTKNKFGITLAPGGFLKKKG